MSLIRHPFICRKDNIALLLHDPHQGETACIDAPEARPILQELRERKWRLTHLLITHHHHDHVEGIEELKTHFPSLNIYAPYKGQGKIPFVDQWVREGDIITIGSSNAHVLETPGHTLDSISYDFTPDGFLCAGDTLFAYGCGRVFEGDMAQLWSSLLKIRSRPEEITLYYGHECGHANAQFALSVDPKNESLRNRILQEEAMRTQNLLPPFPTLALEKRTNPFLRADDPVLQKHLHLEGTEASSVFTYLRTQKNTF